VPTTCIIAGDGSLLASRSGYTTYEDLQEVLKGAPKAP